MKMKNWMVIILVGSLFLLGYLPAGRPLAATPSTGLSSDSFSQEAGDCYIWELMVNRNVTLVYGYEEGSRQKLDVTVVNSTDMGGGMMVDAVFGNLYSNSPSDRTWALLVSDMQVMAYANSMGMTMGMYCVIPHNGIAVNQSLKMYGFMTFMFTFTMTTFTWFNWTSGPHGYDGTYEMWNGTEIGAAKYEKKVLVKYNEEGACQLMRWYNGTGTDWELTDESVLQTPLKPVLQAPVLGGTNVTGYNATLTWNAVTNATSYYVYRSTTPITQMAVKTMVPLINTTALTYCDLTVPDNKTSYYGVVAGNVVANSSISRNQLVNLTSSAAPTEPTTPGISGFVPVVFVTSFAVLVVIWRKRQKSLAF